MRTRPRSTSLYAALLTLPFASACRVGPQYREPELQLPDQWHQAVSEELAAESGDFRTWWTVFGDPTLDALIDRAAAGNLNLEIAAARVREARALRRIVKADRVPTVDLTGEAGRTKLSDSVDPFARGAYDSYRLDFQASWELDVWGRVRSSVDAAGADIQATEEALRDLLVLLYAEVAINYVDLRTYQARLRFAEGNVAAQESTLKLVNDRFDAQLVPALDIRQAEMNLARTQSLLPTLHQNSARAAHRIAVLLGSEPGAVYELLEQTGAIPASDAAVQVGIPAEVLRRRPDIRQAERALAAQTARIGVAEANLYPQFALTGRFGWDALNGSDLFTSGTQAWGISIPFRWNLFDRGRIKGDIAAQEARADALQAGYEQTVLLALEEVENSMVSLTTERDRVGYLQASADAAQQAVELVRELYNAGLKDFQPVLDSERTLAEQQDALASSQGLVARELIGLYTALGGGWDPEADVEALVASDRDESDSR
ncbi:MAG: efflux transporter outer membrane subunit [Planctomycetes bacterium]|nr:efflux transporter outer membrane subunit [Planctomycetota bacterium]